MVFKVFFVISYEYTVRFHLLFYHPCIISSGVMFRIRNTKRWCHWYQTDIRKKCAEREWPNRSVVKSWILLNFLRSFARNLHTIFHLFCRDVIRYPWRADTPHLQLFRENIIDHRFWIVKYILQFLFCQMSILANNHSNHVHVHYSLLITVHYYGQEINYNVVFIL